MKIRQLPIGVDLSDPLFREGRPRLDFFLRLLLMPRSFSPRIFLALHRPQERSLECYFRRPRLSGSLYRAVGIFMSRVPALPNLFASRESAPSLVIAELGIRESFTVVRTRLPLALVLNYGGPSSASLSLPAPGTLQRLYVPTLSSASRGKARRKWLFHQSYTGLAVEVRPVGALRQKFKARYMRESNPRRCSSGIYI